MADPEQEQAAIYATRARDYHALVMAEDCEGALARALASRVALEGRRIVEVGAGTGRVTALLARAGAHVRAFEREPAMLEVARGYLEGLDVELAIADARALPIESGSADALVAGWVFGHFRLWMPARWREEIGLALREARRVVRAGGSIVIVETLGTGTSEAAPPSEALAEYYRFLEEEHGFAREILVTDYFFRDPDEAASVLGSFFGAKLADRVRERAWARVPERTGLWSLTLP